MGRTVLLACVFGVFCVATSQAATISIVPGTQNATVGTPVSVGIDVSGLAANESIGGVALTLAFNQALVSGASMTLDPNAKMGFALDPVNNNFGSGFTGAGGSPATIVFLADVSITTDAALKALQGTGFRLATITFNPIANGLTPLTLGLINGSAPLSNGVGLAPLNATLVSGSICVGGNCTVTPEPASLLLLSTGAAALFARRRRKTAKSNI
jgi:hypothetical protein